MRNIAVITGTRAEYGLLKNTIKCINEDADLNLQLIVTGAHLSEKYGYTIREIQDDGFNIDEKIDILMEEKNEKNIAVEMSNLIAESSKVYDKLKPDIILVLGDRYEIFAAVIASMTKNIPIAHISGGEITEGAMDEQIRHSITKMAHIHFPGALEYAENIKKMGEEEWRIFNVGDPGIENIMLTKLFAREEIKDKIGVDVNENTMLVTFHPVTLEINDTKEYIDNLILALSKTNNNNIIITYPNSDNGGDIIIKQILEFEKTNNKVRVFKNLGSLLYLSVLNQCGIVIGNSSSGIVEAPFMKKPVINIGNRQKGRLLANNIINCDYSIDSISKAIKKAVSIEFKEFVKENTISLYGEGETSKKIVKVLKEIELGEKLIKKKLVW